MLNAARVSSHRQRASVRRLDFIAIYKPGVHADGYTRKFRPNVSCNPTLKHNKIDEMMTRSSEMVLAVYPVRL